MFESTSFKRVNSAFEKRKKQLMRYFYFFLFFFIYLSLGCILAMNEKYVSEVTKLFIYNPVNWVMSLRLFPLFWFNFISCILLSIFYYNKLGLSGFFKLNALGLILF